MVLQLPILCQSTLVILAKWVERLVVSLLIDDCARLLLLSSLIGVTAFLLIIPLVHYKRRDARILEVRHVGVRFILHSFVLSRWVLVLHVYKALWVLLVGPITYYYFCILIFYSKSYVIESSIVIIWCLIKMLTHISHITINSFNNSILNIVSFLLVNYSTSTKQLTLIILIQIVPFVALLRNFCRTISMFHHFRILKLMSLHL